MFYATLAALNAVICLTNIANAGTCARLGMARARRLSIVLTIVTAVMTVFCIVQAADTLLPAPLANGEDGE